MAGWAEDWTSALSRPTKSFDDYCQKPIGIAATHTPHPALASSSEANEWEAVLAATERPGAVSTATGVATNNNRERRGAGVYAVVELGSHSTRLLLSAATGDTDVVSAS
jgi:hypothetical protein